MKLGKEMKIKSDTKLKWRCAKGHRWTATYNMIQQGSWCRICAGNKKKTTDDYNLLAARYDGKCLSKKIHYVGYNKTVWECSKGHKFRASYISVKSGVWCPICTCGRCHRLIYPSYKVGRNNAKKVA